jgi:hypothetical protein
MAGRGVNLVYPKQTASWLYMSGIILKIVTFSRLSVALMGKKGNHSQF